MSDKDREELFIATALKIGIRPEAVEKDFWVCFILDHLFHDCEYNKAFVFKGGTSLSKSYHLINRFSEDIDLILDWRIITGNQSEYHSRFLFSPIDMTTRYRQAYACRYISLCSI